MRFPGFSGFTGFGLCETFLFINPAILIRQSGKKCLIRQNCRIIDCRNSLSLALT